MALCDCIAQDLELRNNAQNEGKTEIEDGDARVGDNLLYLPYHPRSSSNNKNCSSAVINNWYNFGNGFGYDDSNSVDSKRSRLEEENNKENGERWGKVIEVENRTFTSCSTSLIINSNSTREKIEEIFTTPNHRENHHEESSWILRQNQSPQSRRRRCQMRNWVFLGSIVLLSLLGRIECLTIFEVDDDSDDTSAYSNIYRTRRSAEAFSSLKDAESLIPANYSIHEPPPTNNSEATKVDFSVLIMNVRDIKELNEGRGKLELSLEMNLRIYWKDTRLGHLADKSGNKFVVLNPVVLDKIWHPDIFIDHVKAVSQPALISKPASLRIYPDSSVRYSARITVSMACQMDFHYYPADTQRCDVDIKSYAYSSKILALDWREGKGALLVDYLDLPNFDVALDTTQNFMVNTSSGSYSGIRFTILLRRKLSYHLIQTYLPSALFIVVSWLSFLVPPESVPGRMALCMTTLLTLTAMFSAVRQNTPNVSYVKALDIWMVVCIIFVFLTLVEYTVLLKLKSKKPKDKSKPKSQPPVSTTNGQQHGSQSALPTLAYRSYGEYPTIQIRRPKLTESSFNGNGNGNGNGVGDGTRRVPSEPNLQTLPPLPPPPPPPPAPAPAIPLEPILNKYELAAWKLEKFTSAIIPTLFVVFNFIYWPWLIESAHYYHHVSANTVYHSV